MAQILKDSSRQLILENARQEFLEYGFQGASMRRIAARSQMTVGNLYRYFKSKQDINRVIVEKTLDEVNNMVMELSGRQIDFTSGRYEISLDAEQLLEILSALSQRLVDIYWRHKVEFRILMMHSDLNNELTEWMTNIISHYIQTQLHHGAKNRLIEALARCEAIALFSGFNDLFAADLKKDELSEAANVYMQLFLGLMANELQLLEVGK